MNKKRRKRRQIVNYCVRQYSGNFMMGNLVIGKTHPFFKKSFWDLRDLVREHDGYFSPSNGGIMYGNTKGMHIICPKRFRNLNFRVIYFTKSGADKKEFTEAVMDMRFILMMDYIKEKRSEY